MIKGRFTVHCDRCGRQRGPVLCSEYHADAWVEDNDDDYEEYGQFSDGVPRCREIFHKAGGRLYCAECTELMIRETKVAR